MDAMKTVIWSVDWRGGPLDARKTIYKRKEKWERIMQAQGSPSRLIKIK